MSVPLALVEDGGLPAYPEELMDPQMSSDYFTMFYHDRYLNSELHLTAGLDVQGAALNLFFIARKQTPIGSLPDNDRMIAKLLRIDLEVWERLIALPVGPLHNWAKYNAAGRTVWGHPVVIEVASNAINRREHRDTENNDKAVYQRIKRLKENMKASGFTDDAIADTVLVERMDGWLVDHHKGQRRQPAYDRVYRHASTERWFGTQNQYR